MPRGAGMSCCRSSSSASVAPGRDLELRLHQIDAGDLLGHGVLDLQARIGLDEGDRRIVAMHRSQSTRNSNVPAFRYVHAAARRVAASQQALA